MIIIVKDSKAQKENQNNLTADALMESKWFRML